MKNRYRIFSRLFLIFLILLSEKISAQIVCTDIVPDSVVSITMGGTASYTTDIDLNNDAVFDFRINMVQSGSFGFVNVQAAQIGTLNSIMSVASTTAQALTAGTQIAPTSTTWVQMNGSNQQMSIFAAGPPILGSFPGNGDRYLGVRFQAGLNTHYGWIRFNFSNAVNSYTVKDYAYNATPNGSIAAGSVCAPLYTPAVIFIQPTVCAVNTTSVMANTGTIAVNGYSWSAAPGGCIFSAPNFSYSVLTFPGPGIYSITLSTSVGTVVSSSTSTIQVGPPSLTVVSTSSMLCSGQTSTLTASGANTYSWASGPNTATFAVTPTVTSTYTISGSTAVGCSITVSFTQQVMVCAGVKEFGNEDVSFSVFPNPAKDQLFIELKTNEVLEANIELFNLIGKKVLCEPYLFSNETPLQRLSVSSLEAGIYFVKISAEGNSQIMKFREGINDSLLNCNVKEDLDLWFTIR